MRIAHYCAAGGYQSLDAMLLHGVDDIFAVVSSMPGTKGRVDRAGFIISGLVDLRTLAVIGFPFDCIKGNRDRLVCRDTVNNHFREFDVDQQA